MSSQTELYKGVRESQNKITYFLMTAAGAGIGFSISQTKDSWLGINHIPLGCAVLFWGLSFYFGCRYHHQITYHMVGNLNAIKLDEKKIKSETDVMIQEFIQKDMNRANDKAYRSFNWQFALLILGAISFIGWHVYEMYLRSISTAFGN